MSLKYGDTSLIVHGYTQEEGRVSFILRGAFRQANGKKGSSNHGTVLLHPLSIVNYVASKSPKGSMSYLKEFSPKYRLHSIREDFSKISIAMFISELLYRTLLHSERDGELYISGIPLRERFQPGLQPVHSSADSPFAGPA